MCSAECCAVKKDQIGHVDFRCRRHTHPEPGTPQLLLQPHQHALRILHTHLQTYFLVCCKMSLLLDEQQYLNAQELRRQPWLLHVCRALPSARGNHVRHLPGVVLLRIPRPRIHGQLLHHPLPHLVCHCGHTGTRLPVLRAVAMWHHTQHAQPIRT